MARKAKPDQSKLITEAALSLADKKGWEAVTLKDIAKKARLPENTVRALFPDVPALMLRVLRDIDLETSKAVAADGAWRDNLFDLLMTHFELIEKHRHAHASILPALLKNPKAAPRFARPFCQSMQRKLKVAGAPSSPPHVLALGGIYISLLNVWRDDDTPDLSRTMAAVDKRLSFFERAIAAIPCPR